MSTEMIGPKAERLSALRSSGFPVPPFHIVAADALDRFLAHDAELDRAFSHYRRGFINKLDVLGRARHVADAVMATDLPEFLAAEILSGLRSAGVEGPWITRSSGSLEDTDGVDLAGAYDSVPDLADTAVLLRGIRQCWASLFSPRALLRFNESSASVDGAVRDLSRARMSVIVQTQIHGPWSGVAFTADPGTGNESIMVVEASRDLGGVAHAGAEVARAVVMRTAGALTVEQRDGELPDALSLAVADLARRVHDWAGCAQDVEWVCDDADRVHVVQTRPVRTRPGAVPAAAGDVFRLVHVGSEGDDFPLGHCSGIARSYRAKKLELRALATQLHIPVPTWYWLHYDLAGLRRAQQTGGLPRFESDFVQVDVSTNIRALLRPVAELPGTLAELARAHPADRLTVHVRDAIPTEIGAVSAALPDGGVVVEYVMGTLQGLRSGISEASTVVVDAENRVTREETAFQSAAEMLDPAENRIARHPFGRRADRLPAASLAAVADGTRALAARRPGIRPEWWLWADRVWLADASFEEADLSGTSVVLSDGSAKGTVVRVLAGEIPEDLSNGYAISADAVNDEAFNIPALQRLRGSRPWLPDRDWIVVADRPRVELALLLPWARGFVFEQGSLLSHLAITLRAKGTPAVVSRQAYTDLVDGQHIEVHEGDVCGGR